MRDRIESQQIDEDQLADINAFKELFIQLLENIEEVAANPRYQALAITHLEIASLFTTKMISHAEVR